MRLEAAGATVRLLWFLTDDSLFNTPRLAAWARWPRGTWLGDLIRCPYCLGVWVSAGVLVAHRVAPGPARVVGRWLALAAVAAALAHRLGNPMPDPADDELPPVAP